MHALSDLLSQDPEDSFALGGSDAGTAPTALAARAPKRVRSNVVAAKPGGAKARRTSAGGSAGGAARGGKQQSGSDSGTQGTTTQPTNAQQ